MPPPKKPRADAPPIGISRRKRLQDFNDEDRRIYSHEIMLAREIQEHLLPKRIPKVEGLEMSAYYEPCEYVGGDYYDFVEIDDKHLGLVIADVSGKGMPGALIMTEVRTFMKTEAMRTISPRQVALGLNRLLYEDTPKGMFVTLFYAVIDIPESEVTCVSCGHNPSLLYRNSDARVTPVNPEGVALGILDNDALAERLRSAKFTLGLHDRLVLYTDGLVEVMDEGHKIFRDSFIALTEKCGGRESEEYLSIVLRASRNYRGKRPQHDDLTIVTVRRVRGHATPNEAATVLNSEKFVQCAFCRTVNTRTVRRCTVCNEPIGTSLAPSVGIRAGEFECRVCKKSVRHNARACSNCMTPVCSKCGKRSAKPNESTCERCVTS